MKRIADLRDTIASLDEAKEAMKDIAGITVRLAVAQAKTEQKILKAKEQHDESTAEDRAELDQLEKRLAGFINSHKSLFTKPRKQATEFGAFGLQDVNSVEVQDKHALLDYLNSQMSQALAAEDLSRHDYLCDCIKTTVKIDKTNLRKVMTDECPDEHFPGCCLNDGDTVVLRVSKTYVNQEKEKVLG